jgi:glycosyltransferase involved in cell wall biosynthesis
VIREVAARLPGDVPSSETNDGVMDQSTDHKKRPRVAVAIPCYNEGPALRQLFADWRAALPEADLILFDNNSTDDSARIALDLGVRVVPVSRQGKGFVVRALFAELADRDAVVMADGDGTYPASEVRTLLDPILAGQADMTVGARVPDASLGAMSPVRSLGNVLIRFAFLVLMGISGGDLLSGYRVFGPRFLRSVRLKSHGFEIETELACIALAGGFKVIEKQVPYLPRAAGTASKLNAVRDGLRILKMMARQSLRLKPWRIGGLMFVLLVGLAWFFGSGILWITAGTLLGVMLAMPRPQQAPFVPLDDPAN